MQPPPTAADHADTLLVVRCQLGERAAFDALIRRWAAPLQRYALKLTRDPALADDLVQDVWLRAVRGLGRLRDAAQFRPWLFGIAHRTFADRLRERYAMTVDADVDWDTFAAVDDDGEDAEDRERALAGGLERLPLVEREVLTLFYLEALPLAEIATALGIPTGTVKSRLFRARALLRHHLTAEK
ncbi:RNA polymerase sigma factor [Tahibacter caeni]|uniref:RNA polymerase sigma factor n=1 Tax=Tahibacter caeni TaxID=1453545 RepID=UPI00214778A0